MDRIFLGNAFSLQMINLDESHIINVTPVTIDEVSKSDFESVIGHGDTANVLTSLLGKTVLMNRASVTLNPSDVLYVAQITGGRLPEGSIALPENFSMKFVKVTVS